LPIGHNGPLLYTLGLAELLWTPGERGKVGLACRIVRGQWLKISNGPRPLDLLRVYLQLSQGWSTG
jgi:hypothetical protein